MNTPPLRARPGAGPLLLTIIGPVALLVLSACQPLIRVQVVGAALPQVAQAASHIQPAAPPSTPDRLAGVQAARKAVEPPPAAPLATPTKRPAATRTERASEPPTRIVAPAIGLDAAVVSMGWALSADGRQSEWQLPDGAAGFHADSALPGQRGNAVISGHHNIKGKVFAHVYQLKPGDEVDLYVGEQRYRYVVDDSFIVPERGASDEQRRQNASWIAPTGDERLTLVTCWPPNDNSHRVIVLARPLR